MMHLALLIHVFATHCKRTLGLVSELLVSAHHGVEALLHQKQAVCLHRGPMEQSGNGSEHKAKAPHRRGYFMREKETIYLVKNTLDCRYCCCSTSNNRVLRNGGGGGKVKSSLHFPLKRRRGAATFNWCFSTGHI